MERFRRVFLFINRGKERVRELGRGIALDLLDLDRTLIVAAATRDHLAIGDLPVEIADPPAGADLAVVLGGDGTLLSAVAAFAPAGVPMLGINLGTLGFLSAVPPRLAASAFRRVFGPLEPPVRELPVIEAALLRGGRRTGQFPAVNDVVVGRNAAGKLNVLDLDADGRYVDTLIGDGAVVATQAGSTGYALSCGGPIVPPGVEALVVAPVASHCLASRPLLLPASSRVTLRVKSGHDDGVLSVDGQVHVALRDEDVVEVTATPQRARLLDPDPADFFETVRSKLAFGAGGRPR